MANSSLEVLLVEDNPADVELTREALKDGKVLINLNVVDDGVKALAYLRKEPPYSKAGRPDLVLLDLNLPRKDGREVLQEIKGSSHTRAIPVVVLTTSEAEADIAKSYDLGINAYITKPVGFEEFRRVVELIDEFWFTVVKLPRR